MHRSADPGVFLENDNIETTSGQPSGRMETSGTGSDNRDVMHAGVQAM
jgi:hypothetical protein